MPMVRTVETEDPVRVAVVFEIDGRIRPVWLASPVLGSGDQVKITSVCSVWEYSEGAARILVFEVSTDHGQAQLKLDTRALTWRLAVTIED